ncbi:methionine adenosyltransferase [Simkania negevensis]|uniref:S-adenosylmethionine synthase n=1 Tax=Simkania negevensis TaxID=83561 RepID=A0ABS3AT54_9BACT|nr:methionine adenosyltransferase [Simkania negevensis]
MSHSFFSSESVCAGHPDKVADQISDAILDALLQKDPEARVACETLVTSGLVLIAGEITTTAYVDYQDVVRRTIKEIGYEDPVLGFDWESCAVLIALNKQSPDIAMGVDEGQGLFKEMGAGDQGMMFGFACDETPELMPLPITLAHKIARKIEDLRTEKTLPYLRPDGKTQVTVEYDEKFRPVRVDTAVISTQHAEDVAHETIVKDMRKAIRDVVPACYLDDKTRYLINPTGRFVVGGPMADCGLTGRKIVVDTYGGMARHGGGCFSGKDPSKVDRAGAYAARYVAKNVVAAGLAKKCEVQIAYAIGYADPVSVKVTTFATSSVGEEVINRAIRKVFSLTPKGIIEMLQLKKPCYRKTASGGHFGRTDISFMWEAVDRVEELKKAVKNEQEKKLNESRQEKPLMHVGAFS